MFPAGQTKKGLLAPELSDIASWRKNSRQNGAFSAVQEIMFPNLYKYTFVAALAGWFMTAFSISDRRTGKPEADRQNGNRRYRGTG
ncbi:hypothetical protein NAI82_11250 [Oxalobacter sp. JAC-2022]|uniref:hypothetical protein n=1 Tax=Oxalobacter aliiformigenes TaxID=2946593 RepID=UPI0022AFE1B9|nr:hypothetical protein [Oxalobacter aliiformigenes]MCZ4066002.1 hypothetical protein [Oxalobacter aliiformigenes]